MPPPIRIGRRSFIAAGMAAGTMPWSGLLAAPGDAEFVAAYGDGAGRFGYAIFNGDGLIRLDRKLSARAHGAAADAGRHRMVMIARRPGRFALVIDVRNGDVIRRIEAAEGRRFCGHGQFTPDGTLLMTENDHDAGRGVIGMYDRTRNYDRIGEIETGGIGPHEMLLSADGRTAIVANGGIETHPDYGRLKLNLATMQPSLALIDLGGNRPARIFRAPDPLHQLSLRHIAVDANGAVWIGGQYEGAPTETPPLLARVHPEQSGNALHLFDTVRGFRNYIGSVAVSGDGRALAVTAPKADMALCLDGRSGAVRERVRMSGVCGVAGLGKGFVVTGGGGDIAGLDAGLPTRNVDGRRWDNHLLRLPAG